MIRITVHTSTHVTVTRTPGRLVRWLLGREKTVRDATQTRIIGGALGWIYDDDRDCEVEPEIADAIDRMTALTAVRERLERLARR